MAKLARLEKITDRVYVSNVGAVLQFVSRRDAFDSGSVMTFTVDKVNARIKSHGKNNNLPNLREAVIKGNAILPNLHVVQRNIFLGGGVYAFKWQQVNGKDEKVTVPFPTKILAKYSMSDINRINETVANEYVKHSMAAVEFVLQKDGTLIGGIGTEAKKVRDIRAEWQNENGKIAHWWWSNAWSAKDVVDTKVLIRIPSYDATLDQKGREKQGKFIFVIKDEMFDDNYYPCPPIDGVVDWAELANAIAIFHKRNLENGFNIRVQVKIPEDYFFNYKAVESGLKTEEDAVAEAATAEQNFIDKMNEFFAGVRNAGRAVYTKKRMVMEKEYPGIEIVHLEYDMKDEALLKVDDLATIKILSNQGVPPPLASIQLPKQFGSGAENRTALNLFQIVQAPFPRKKILSWLKLVADLEGVDSEIEFDFRDKEMVTLDKAPTGTLNN